MNPQTVAQAIKNQRDDLAEIITERIYADEPGLMDRFGEIGREKSLRDVKYNLTYLAEAIHASSPSLFADYLSWLKVVLADYPGLSEGLANHILHTQTVLLESLPQEMETTIKAYVDVGLAALAKTHTAPPSFVAGETPLTNLARQYLDALLQGERHTATQLILEAVNNGTSVKDIYLGIFQPVLHEIGRLWQTNQVSVAQEHYCTAATQLIMSQLYGHIFSSEKIGRRLVATSVGNELHEIGVRMVADFFEMDGWDTYYLGANTPTESILQTTERYNAHVLGISATMTYHVSTVADLIQTIRASSAGTGKTIKIIVGGYPFNVDPTLWGKIEADGYAPDAQVAIEVANQLTNGDQ